jgi:hypothetical protein
MARIIYSFEHPIDKLRYFYLHNTRYESVETIPMDLANFIWYYQSIRNNIEGFEDIYNQLKNNENYFLNISFASKPEEEKRMLYDLVLQAGTNEMAKINKLITAQLDEYLSNTQNEDLLIGVSKVLKQCKFIPFRPLAYFYSWHYVYDFIYMNGRNELDFFPIKKVMFNEEGVDLDTIASICLNFVENNDMPISIIPHVVRNNELVQNYIKTKNFKNFLPFKAIELLKERKQYKFIKKKPNEFEINTFFSAVESCDYGIADNLKEEIQVINKLSSQITYTEKKEILKKVFCDEINLVNLIDKDGNELLPPIYTSFYLYEDNSEGPYIFSKYGIQTLDLYSKYGALLYEEAYDYHFMYPFVFATDHSMDVKILKYNEDTDSLYFIHNLKEANYYDSQLMSNLGEGKIYFMNGFINENFEPQSPFCFDSNLSYHHVDKTYSEGLAPVSLNGKWGFIDHSSNIVIPFQYGDAFPFKNGKAKVFKLKEEFKKSVGVWKEIPSNEAKVDRFKMSAEDFKKHFPFFPETIQKPLVYFRNHTHNQIQLAMEYHSFDDGVVRFEDENWDVSYFGKWIYIDKHGNELGDLLNEEINHNNKSIPENYCFKIQEMNHWIKLVEQNNYEVNNLPDSLYLNKVFILKLIENSPGCFQFLKYLYIEDIDCKNAYDEAIKKSKTQSTKDNVSNSDIELMNDDDDDLPF